MNPKIEEDLERQLETQVLNLSMIEDGSEEKSRAVEDVAKLYKVKLEEEKIQEDIKLDKKSKRIGFIIDGAKILVPLAFYGVFWIIGFKFEETGNLNSQVFRELRGKFPKFDR